MPKILIIDDEKPIRSTLKEILEYEKFQVDVAADGLAGLEMVKKEKYDVVLCDIKMPQMDGMEVLDNIMKLEDEPSVIMISGHGTIDVAVDALKKGAYDYIAKPLDLNRLLITIRNAMDRTQLVKETKVLKKKLSKAKTSEIIGESAAVAKVIEMINKVAPTDERVLVTGGNGS